MNNFTDLYSTCSSRRIELEESAKVSVGQTLQTCILQRVRRIELEESTGALEE